jgi:hypothetical protein
MLQNSKPSVDRATHRNHIRRVFCKTHLANMLQNSKPSVERATHRIAIISGVCFVTFKDPSCKYVTKEPSIKSESNASLSYQACCFVRSILQICYKRTKHQTRKQRIAIISGVLFCKTHLANMLQNRKPSVQSTESPILFRSCEHETPFSDQKEASKIGDSVLCFSRESNASLSYQACVL